MVIENGIKSDTALTNWADSDTKNDCANTSAYFKVSRNLELNGSETHCKFRAADGVFWDISDIKKPLIALREQDLNAETAQSDTNRAFYMFGWLDEQGSLRSNDMGKIDATNKADLEKLYDFIAGKTKTSMGKISDNQNNNNNSNTNQEETTSNKVVYITDHNKQYEETIQNGQIAYILDDGRYEGELYSNNTRIDISNNSEYASSVTSHIEYDGDTPFIFLSAQEDENNIKPVGWKIEGEYEIVDGDLHNPTMLIIVPHSDLDISTEIIDDY